MRWHPKLIQRFDTFLFGGFFTLQEAEAKQMRLVTGKERQFCLYWLVDESDGIIADAKFQAFGPTPLLLIGDIVCELVLRKTYDQASRISADLIDRYVRDKPQDEVFSSEDAPFLNQALLAIDRAVEQCEGIPFAQVDYETTPIAWALEETTEIPGWLSFPAPQQIAILQEVLDKEIRPYVELDAGGVELLGVQEGREVLIAYQGSCTSCHAATGSTLSAIQNILRARVHPELRVIPQ